MVLSSTGVVLADTGRASSTVALELRQATEDSSVSYTQAGFPIYIDGVKVSLDQPALKVNVDTRAIAFLSLRAFAEDLPNVKIYFERQHSQSPSQQTAQTQQPISQQMYRPKSPPHNPNHPGNSR